MGESRKEALRLGFDGSVRLEFRGATVSSDGGLLAYRDVDDAFALTATAGAMLSDWRNQVRLQLIALAYNLGNFLRRLALPASVKHWTLTTLRNKLIKIRMQGRASRQARGVPVGGGGDPPIPVRSDPPPHRAVEAAGPGTPMITIIALFDIQSHDRPVAIGAPMHGETGPQIGHTPKHEREPRQQSSENQE
jgi:hypothetical protein